MNSTQPNAAKSARRKGLLRLLIGVAVFIPLLAVLVYFSQHANHLLVPIGLLLPGAYAFAGLAELITGVPFPELARRWDELQGWQRGIYGTLLVLFGAAVVFSVIGAVLSRMVNP